MIHALCIAVLFPTLAAAQETEGEPAPERVVALELPAGPGALCPDVALASEGTAWVSWIEPAGEGEHALRVARFDGSEFRAPLQVARGENWFVNWADFPTLAARTDGGVLASWLVSRGAKRGHYDPFVALSPDGEAAFGEAARLDGNETEAEYGFVSLAALDEGRFGAIWLDGSDNLGAHAHGSAGAGATALRYAVVTAAGEPGPSVVLDPRVCDCCQTAMVRRASGELVVAYRGRSAEEVRDIAFVRLPAESPARASKPRSVHVDGWTIPGCPVNGPALAVDGELVAASWFTLGADREARVELAWLSPDAEDFGPPRRIDDGAPEGRVDLAFVADELWASWMERVGDHAEWRVRRVPRDATAELPPSLLVAEVPLHRKSGFLRMAPLEGSLLAVWTDDGLHAARVNP